MRIDDAVLAPGEKLALGLRQLYLDRGYLPYRMGKFEEYDFYARHKDFLVSDNVLTFTDTDGKLLALKPDVTLSMIRNLSDEPDNVRRFFYNENVYRVSKGTGSFGEIMQSGVECLGKVGTAEVAGVIDLACESLEMINPQFLLCICPLGLVEALVKQTGAAEGVAGALIEALSRRMSAGMKKICDENGLDYTILQGLTDNPVGLKEASALIERWAASGDGAVRAQARETAGLIRILETGKRSAMLRVDFSAVADGAYYNDTVFSGFVPGVPEAVLSGGRYDNLMDKLSRRSRAVGFAVYTDRLARTPLAAAAEDTLSIALPKGRLGEEVYSLFEKAGYGCGTLNPDSRALILENPERRVRFFWVKPSDVAVYVERGAADLGVTGEDIIMEYRPDVYELLDLNVGKCTLAVAAPDGWQDSRGATLRVATKFPSAARSYFRSRGRDIDIIRLNGSIELAPLLGLSDVIVDIVQTGTTLKENSMSVVEKIAPLSARLTANKASFRFKSESVNALVAALVEEVPV